MLHMFLWRNKKDISILQMKKESVQNWVTLDQKLGHRAKSKEDLVSTLEVTFFESIIMNLAKNVCLDDL